MGSRLKILRKIKWPSAATPQRTCFVFLLLFFLFFLFGAALGIAWAAEGEEAEALAQPERAINLPPIPGKGAEPAAPEPFAWETKSSPLETNGVWKSFDAYMADPPKEDTSAENEKPPVAPKRRIVRPAVPKQASEKKEIQPALPLDLPAVPDLGPVLSAKNGAAKTEEPESPQEEAARSKALEEFLGLGAVPPGREELGLPFPSASEEESPALAQPERPLDLPNAPGLRPVGALKVPSTEEENEAFIADKEEWKNLEDFVRGSDEGIEASQKGKDLAFQVRFAPLPNAKVKAAPDKRITTSVADRMRGEAAKKSAKTVPSTSPRIQAPPEACQALADMRRQQLEAIESDRRTLAALREALAELGLTSRLSFMAAGQERPEAAGTEVIGTAPSAPSEPPAKAKTP